MERLDMRIGEVSTELIISEGVGPLSAGEVKQLVEMVLAEVRKERDRAAQYDHDVTVRDRASYRRS
jgi:hypothetical protein